MKVSEITAVELISYLRLEYETLEDKELSELNTLLGVAKSFVMSYTGLTADYIDKYEDLTIVIYILVQDMYDNRALYIDKNNLNKVVETILGMHSVNLL